MTSTSSSWKKDALVGNDWTVDIEFGFFGQGDSRQTGETRVDWTFNFSDSAGNLQVFASGAQIPLVYEDGAWRVDLCTP